MRKFVISSQDQLRFINTDDILFCRSESCYTYVTLQSSEEILVCKSLALISKELDDCKFIRVNQSFLVNPDSITSIDKKKKLIRLTNDYPIHFTTSIKEIVMKISTRGAAVYVLIFQFTQSYSDFLILTTLYA